MFLVKIAISENDVVICPVLFLPIIMMAKMCEIKAMPKGAQILKKGHQG